MYTKSCHLVFDIHPNPTKADQKIPIKVENSKVKNEPP